MKNIFQIFIDGDHHVPFVVRRESWNSVYGLCVVHVELDFKYGVYGKAFGFALPPLDGSLLNSYWGVPGSPKKVSCAGCYQWILVFDVPKLWRSYVGGQ